MKALSAFQQRLAAIALLAIAALLIGFLGLAPLVEYIRHSADVREARLISLSRDRALLAQDSTIQADLVALAQSPRWARFYRGSAPDQAVLQLETDLRDLFNAPSNPTSMSAQLSTQRGLLTQLAVRMTLSMSIDQFTHSLGLLQSHPQLLQILDLTVQAPENQVTDANPTLTIQLEVVGYMVTPTGTSS